MGFYYSLLDWQSEKLLKMVGQLQPYILVNDRLDLNDVPSGWDTKTPEQLMVRERVRVDGKPVLWETYQIFSGSWGHHRDESTWRNVKQLVQKPEIIIPVIELFL